MKASPGWRLRVGMIATLLFASAVAARAGEATPPEPAGYWQGPMLGKVPATITGGTAIGTDGLADMVRQDKPVLIDVVPAPRRPSDQSMPWMPMPHRNIPRSVWIPGAGAGVISAAMEDYFRARLTELTGGNPEKLIVSSRLLGELECCQACDRGRLPTGVLVSRRGRGLAGRRSANRDGSGGRARCTVTGRPVNGAHARRQET